MFFFFNYVCHSLHVESRGIFGGIDSTMWIVGIELRSLGLLASIFICWAILLALRSLKRIIYHLFIDLLKDLVIFLGMTLDI